MSSQWIHRDEQRIRDTHHLKSQAELRKLIIELAAAVVRLDRNGYQTKLLASCLDRAGVQRDQVDAFNVERAERIARWKANQ